MVWFVTPWLFCIAIFSLPIIVHREQMELHHVAYILICFVAFWLGQLIYLFGGRRKVLDADYQRSDFTRYALICAALGFLGYVTKIADQVLVTGLSLQDRLMSSASLSDVRALRNSASMAGAVGPFSRLHFLSVFSLVFIAIFFLAGKDGLGSATRALRLKVAVGVTFGLVAFNSLFIEAGRVDFVIFLLLVFCVFVLDRRRSILKAFAAKSLALKISLLSAVFLIIILSSIAAIYFLRARIGAYASPELLLTLTHRASFDSDFLNIVGRSVFVQTALLQLSYATTSIATLCYFLDITNAQFPGPFYGVANFPGIFDRLLFKIDNDLYVAEWFDQANYSLVFRGYAANVWSTWLRDLALDMTRPLVPAFLLGFGFLSRFVVTTAYSNRSPIHVLLAAVFLTILAFSAFHTITNRELIWSTLRVCVVLITLLWLKKFFRPRQRRILNSRNGFTASTEKIPKVQ